MATFHKQPKIFCCKIFPAADTYHYVNFYRKKVNNNNNNNNFNNKLKPWHRKYQ